MLLLAFFTFVGLQVNAQTVTGLVTGADDGQPIPGATVSVKGFSGVGTITDFNGKYSINLPEGATTLVFSFVGMETQETAVGGQTVVNAVLQVSSTDIGDVVVTALGVSREKKALGYSVQNVSGDDFTQAKEVNIVNSLSGKIAGVQITNSSGAVGASSRIILRGATSITGNNQPLFVVDGIPIDNTNYGSAGSNGGSDLPGGSSDINPDDIESITVLKGSNAAALYGSRAANGVILIKTKSGKNQKGLGISVNSGITFETPLKLPSFQNSYGQGAGDNYFEFIDGQSGPAGTDESWGPALDVGLQAMQTHSYVNGKPLDWASRPDNIKDFFETGITTSNNIAFTGGNEKTNFRLSYTNMNQKGIVPNTDLKRNTINASSQLKLSDKLKMSFSVNYIKSKSDNRPMGGYDNENPVQQMIWSGRQIDIAALKDYNNLPSAGDNTAAAGTPLNWNTVFQNNPYWVLDNNLQTYDKDRVIGNVRLDYKLTDWLSVKARTGTDYFASKVTARQAFGSNNGPSGSYKETFRTWFETNSDILVMFNKNITDDIGFALNIGGNRMIQKYDRVIGTAPQLELKEVYNVANVKSGVNATLTNFKRRIAINSVYYNGQLSFKKFVFLEFNGRNDWSSVLPTENNSFFYPSFALSTDITEMLGIESNTLSFLKLRAGWAQVGGDGALTAYSLQQTYAFRTTPWGSTLLPYDGNTLNNPNLKSETTTSTEFGLDVRLFQGRVTIDFTYFNTVSKDLLVPVQVSASTGYTFAWDNVGEMKNGGVEALVGLKIMKTKNFSWDATINFSYLTNEVSSLGDLESLDLGGQWNMTLQAREGQAYGSIYGPGFARAPSGEIIYKDGLPQIDETSLVVGNIQPWWTGGIGSTFTFFNKIKLGVLVDAKYGGEIHSMSTSWGRYAGVLSQTLDGRDGGIIGEGVIDNGDGTYKPNDVVVTAEDFNKAAYSNDNVESAVFDASYVKLRQISLGYTFNKLGKLPIKSLTVSVVGRNLAILYSKIPHVDPETAFSSANGEQGQEFGQIPSTRSIGFNINFKF